MKLIYVDDGSDDHVVSATDRLHLGDVEVKITGKGKTKADAVRDCINKAKELKGEFDDYLERIGAL